YAHDLVLHAFTADGTRIDLPALPDARRGGFVVDTGTLSAKGAPQVVRGTLHGRWGFDGFDGPDFTLADAHEASFALAPGDEANLIVGRQATVHFKASSVTCVREVALEHGTGPATHLEWSALHPDELEVRLPLQQQKPGPLSVRIEQFGAAPQKLTLHAFNE